MDKLKIKKKRETSQFLMPHTKGVENSDVYDIYPSFKLPDGNISIDINELASLLVHTRNLIIDGYVGVDFDNFKNQPSHAFSAMNLTSSYIRVEDTLLAEDEIDSLISPFMGEAGSGSVFGTRATIGLKNFFHPEKLKSIKSQEDCDINIVYGVGAQLAGWDGF